MHRHPPLPAGRSCSAQFLEEGTRTFKTRPHRIPRSYKLQEGHAAQGMRDGKQQRTTRKPNSSSLKPQLLLKGPIFLRKLQLKPKITLAKQFPSDSRKTNKTEQHLSYIKNPMARLLAKFIAPRKPRDISLCSPQIGNGKNTWTLKSWEIFVDTRIWGA